MREILIAAVVVGFFLVTSLLVGLVAWDVLLRVGFWVILGGFGVGLPAGTLYHVMLYRALGQMPERWWVNPTHAHKDIPPERKFGVYFWFYTGAAGFLVCMIGALLLFLSTLGSAQ